MHKFTLSMAGLLLAAVATVHADEISLTTSKSSGDDLVLALNTGVSADLTWGSGDSETILFDGAPTTVTVKDASLSISSSSTITLLYVPSDELTALDVSEATGLKKLFCPDNSLTTLDLTANTALVELDCQANNLSTLTLTKCTELEELNCAQNDLSSLTYSTSAASSLKTIVCNDNGVSVLKSYSALSSLQTLWANNNAFSTLTLKKSPDLRQLCMSSNGLTSLTLGAVDNLTDLWLENNSLTELDLTSGAASLVAVSVNDNDLDTIAWDASCKSTLMYFYGQNNNLFFSSFPTATTQLTGVYTPQSPYYITDAVEIGTLLNWGGYLSADGFNSSYSKTFVLVNADGDTLQSGSSNDYLSIASTRWRFYTEQEAVTMYVTGTDYGVTLAIEPFAVVSDLEEYLAGVSGVVVDSATETGIYYDLQGRSVSKPGKGIYIINGKKVFIN